MNIEEQLNFRVKLENEIVIALPEIRGINNGLLKLKQSIKEVVESSQSSLLDKLHDEIKLEFETIFEATALDNEKYAHIVMVKASKVNEIFNKYRKGDNK